MKYTTDNGQNSHNRHMEEAIPGVSLACIALKPELVSELSHEQLSQILFDIGDLLFGLAMDLGPSSSSDPQQNSDHLLTIEQTAERLAVGKDWVYRRSKTLPFAIRQGRLLRF
jgi:hypothetical protein